MQVKSKVPPGRAPRRVANEGAFLYAWHSLTIKIIEKLSGPEVARGHSRQGRSR